METEMPVYTIRLQGHLDARRARQFARVTMTLLPSGETLLTGPIPDQFTLHGILARIRDLGIPLIEVTQLFNKEETMSGKENILQILEKVPLFQKLEPRQLKHIANQFADRAFEAGQEIVKQGQGGIGLFIVVSGHAQAIRERVDGARVIANKFGPGDFFGEMSLLDDGPRTASVIATEATRCLVLLAWDFTSVLRNDSDAALLVLQAVAQRFRQVLDTL